MKRKLRKEVYWFLGSFLLLAVAIGLNFNTISQVAANTLNTISQAFTTRAVTSTTMRIKAVDSADNTTPVAGSTFLVKSPTGGQWVVTSDSNGYAQIPGLTYGDYTISQISAPEGYLGLPTIATVNIPRPALAYPQYADVTIGNTTYDVSQSGTLTVNVVENGNESVVIPYTTVKVVDDLGTIYVGTSNENGQITFRGLSKDRTYYMALLDVPYEYDLEDYIFDETFSLDAITNSQTQTVRLSRTPLSNVIFHSYEKGDNSIPVGGSTFRLTFQDGRTHEFTTDSNGVYRMDLPVSKSYILEQLTSDGTHKIHEESIPFRVRLDFTVNIPNELKDPSSSKVTVRYTKEWKDTPSSAQRATFRLYKNGELYSGAGAQTLSSANGTSQTSTFANLPKYDENHEVINWTVKEDAITDWYATYEETGSNDWHIANHEGALTGDCVAANRPFIYVSSENAAYMLRNGTELVRTILFPNLQLNGEAGTFGHAIAYSKTSGYLYGISETGEVAIMNPTTGGNGSLVKRVILGGIDEKASAAYQTVNGRQIYIHPNFRKLNSGEMSPDGKFLFAKVLGDPNIYVYSVADIEASSTADGAKVQPVKIIPSFHQADPSRWNLPTWTPVSDGDIVVYPNGDLLYTGHEVRFFGVSLSSPRRDPLNYYFYRLKFQGPYNADGTPDYANGSWSAPEKAGSFRAPASVNIRRDAAELEYSVDGITYALGRIFFTSEVWTGNTRKLNIGMLINTDAGGSVANPQTANGEATYNARFLDDRVTSAINSLPINTLDDMTGGDSEVCSAEVSVRGRKHWLGDQESDRPASIEVELYADGVPTGDRVTLNQANNWSYNFTGLTKEKNGQRIVYTVRERNTPAGYVASYDANSYDIINTKVLGSLSFKKTAADGSTGLAGAVFNLWNEDETQMLGTATSAADGSVTFTGLHAGNYILKEITAPDGFTAAATDYRVVGTANQTTNTVDFVVQGVTNNIITNTQPSYRLKVVKVDAATGQKITTTSRFAITDANGNTISGQVANLSNGEFTFTNRAVTQPGTYYLREITAPSGYTGLSDLVAFTIRSDGTVTLPAGDTSQVTAYGLDVLGGNTIELRVNNIKSELVVEKVDDAGNVVTVPAEFKLYQNGQVVATQQTSTTDGRTTFSNLSPNTTYYLEESLAPAGYVRLNNTYTVEVSATGGVSVTLNGQPVSSSPLRVVNEKKHLLTIDKLNSSGNRLAAVRLSIKAKDGATRMPEFSDDAYHRTNFSASSSFFTRTLTWTTSATEAASFSLTPGTYTIEEVSAPDGFLALDAFDLVVKSDGSYALLTADNQEVQELEQVRLFAENNQVALQLTNHSPKLQVKKVDYNSNQALEGATFALYDEAGIKIGEDLTTDGTGLLTFTGIKPGTYYLEETAAPNGYLANTTRYKLVVAKDFALTVENADYFIAASETSQSGDDTLMTVTLKNQVASAKFALSKRIKGIEETGTHGISVPVTFTLTKLNDDSFAPISKTQNFNQNFVFEDLKPGVYLLEETAAPAGYVKTGDVYYVLVDENATVRIVKDNPAATSSLATNLTAIKSSELTTLNSGTDADVFDQNDSTFVWYNLAATGGIPANAYYGVDLGRISQVTRLKFYQGRLNGAARINNAVLEYSLDGTNYTTLNTYTNTNLIEEDLSQAPIYARYIRLRARSANSGWFAMRTIDVQVADLDVVKELTAAQQATSLTSAANLFLYGNIQNPYLNLKKVDPSGNVINSESRFKLYKVDDSLTAVTEADLDEANLVQEFVLTNGQLTTGTGSNAFKADRLGKYALVESQAPTGYRGLAEPVLLNLVEAEQAHNATLNKAVTRFEVLSQQDLVQVDSSQAVNNNTISLTVTNRSTRYNLKLLKRDYNNLDQGLLARFVLYDETGQNQIPGMMGYTGQQGNSLSMPNLPAGTYILKETVVPNGYQPLPSDLKFNISDDGQLTILSGHDSYYLTQDANGTNTVELTIKNLKKGEFPATGGYGTLIYYLIGLLLLGLVAYRRFKQV